MPDRPYQIEAEAASRRGTRHGTNEDAYLAHTAAGLFCVADGMGGHRDGHIASNAIVSILERTLDPGASFEEQVEITTRAITGINASLYRQSRENPQLGISGSTVLSLIVGDGYACCLWVGDSRLYLFRDGSLYLVSEDHAEAGGMLTKAVGSASGLEVDRRVLETRPGDIFLLCSDGLLKGMDEEELANLLGGSGEALTDRLLAKAITGGSTDDITVILVWIGERDG